VLVGELCIAVLSKRFIRMPPVGSGNWIKTNGQRFHSIAFKIKDVHKADEHMKRLGLKAVYADPAFRNTFFLTDEEETFNACIEYCQVEMPNDPRLVPGWSADWWRDEHPLGIERLASITAVVHDLPAAVKLYRDLEFQYLGERTIESDGVKAASFWAGETVFELLSPVIKDTLADRYLKNRGQGWFSANFKVKSPTKAAEYLKSKGLRLIGDTKTRFCIDPRDSFDAVYGFVGEDVPGDPRSAKKR
jgi:methylmalonyl-CoA/ethylmalonyl-CoA epimerase